MKNTWFWKIEFEENKLFNDVAHSIPSGPSFGRQRLCLSLADLKTPRIDSI